MSTTVTVKVEELVLPLLSVARYVTVVKPKLNNWVMLPPPGATETAGATVAPESCIVSMAGAGKTSGIQLSVTVG